MLDKTISSHNLSEVTIIHSDGGCQYRGHEWIEKMKNNGFIRSMSKKRCSPDNSVGEGFFGRLKNEFFYNRDWSNISCKDFIDKLDKYIIWYNNERIKKSLGYKSPIQYRKDLGIIN